MTEVLDILSARRESYSRLPHQLEDSSREDAGGVDDGRAVPFDLVSEGGEEVALEMMAREVKDEEEEDALVRDMLLKETRRRREEEAARPAVMPFEITEEELVEEQEEEEDAIVDFEQLVQQQSTVSADDDDDHDDHDDEKDTRAETEELLQRLRQRRRVTQDDLTGSFYRKAILANGEEVKLRQRSSRFAAGLFQQHQQSKQRAKRDQEYGSDISKMMIEIEEELRMKKEMAVRADVADDGEGTLRQQELWVEKWRASKWVDLVGDERTHRHLLRWIQQWSHAVFKKPADALPKSRPKPGIQADAAPPLATDPFHRPYKKLILLHGPPGLGKTTVAHVAAKQAGYDVLEINASDERGGPAVQAKISGALESHRVGKKPVCIIIDEIDGGAESGFIRVIMDILTSDSKAIQQRPTGTSTTAPKKRKKTHKFLLRPIIAICNDPYVSALRNLRPLAEIVSYKRPPVSVVVTRLREICAAEKVAVDSRTLKELVERTDGDVRSCINTLQFDMGGARVGRQSIGQKDIGASANAIIGRVFRQDKSARTKSERLRAVVEDVERNAEFDKITTGCFALYPSMQYTDDMLGKPVAAGDWLHFYDALSYSMYHNQNRELNQYLSYTAGAFHSMFSSTMNEVKEFAIPKDDYEAREKQRSSKDLLKQTIAQAPASTARLFRQESTIATELAPFLLNIISPKLNPVNSSVLVESEKEMLAHTVDVLIDFGFKYIQQRTESGVYVYRADPPIEQIAKFSVQDQEIAAVGKYMIRQLISQALDMETVRRLRLPRAAAANATKKKRKSEIDDYNDAKKQDGAEEDPEIDNLNSSPERHRDKRPITSTADLLSSSPVKIPEEKPARPTFLSFFTRSTSAADSSQSSTGDSNNNSNGGAHSRESSMQAAKERVRRERESRVWVQFHDGFSNAVKKPIQWNDFWRDL
ncbi:hypothetical protein BZA70DRAFT_279952 [Myxozyma melibiosi]|uniref:AAA+ ATPase domain-containing protein n=1 Tax=Myxozyma melibiosi TaxID=54550 RepID=A0ABR1F6N9_9ASCO